MRRSQLLVRGLAGAVLAGAMLFTGAHEAVAAPKGQPAKVALDGTGVTWQWEDSRFSGSMRCEAGAANARLEIKVTSGDTIGQETVTNVTCDGNTHPFDVLVRPHVGVSFPVGRAWVEARLTSEHSVTGAPLKEGRTARSVWIRPSGKVTPLWPLVINGDGTSGQPPTTIRSIRSGIASVAGTPTGSTPPRSEVGDPSPLKSEIRQDQAARHARRRRRPRRPVESQRNGDDRPPAATTLMSAAHRAAVTSATARRPRAWMNASTVTCLFLNFFCVMIAGVPAVAHKAHQRPTNACRC